MPPNLQPPPQPYSGPAYPQPPSAPSNRRRTYIIGGVAAALVAALIVTALVVAPWSSKNSEATAQRFPLAEGVIATVRVPEGWVARTGTVPASRNRTVPVVALVRANETRSANDLFIAVERFQAGKTADAALHYVVVAAEKTEGAGGSDETGNSRPVGQWSSFLTHSGESRHVTTGAAVMKLAVLDDNYEWYPTTIAGSPTSIKVAVSRNSVALRVLSIDAEPTTPGSDAADVARSLVEGGGVTATRE